MIPPFDERGNLPPGIFETTWADVEARFGGTPQRRELLAGLRAAIGALAAAHCKRVYLNGSFVTTKEQPFDYDGCWEVDGVDSSALDDVFLGEDSPAKQSAKFGGALYPVNALVDPDWVFMLDWFQHDRDGNQKGLIQFDPRDIRQ